LFGSFSIAVEENAMNDFNNWKQERQQLLQRIEELKQQGICYSCYDLETGQVFGNQHIVYEDNLFKVVLELYPRMKGHTIVIYKPHREDISELSEDEACRVFQICVKVVKAIKKALGAEKVYLNTMCDGKINHLHFQLFPRYTGDPIGSERFVSERRPLTNGGETVQLIRSALLTVEDSSNVA
jgi:diadenosine tetraphosphate (Ap4A) HIT family hydrolase